MDFFSELVTELLLLLPLSSALLFLLWKTPHTKRELFSITILFTQLLLSLTSLAFAADGKIVSVAIGSWITPYGIVFVIDGLSALLLSAVNLVFFTTALYGYFERETKDMALLPLTFFLQTGVSLALLTGDFFNLFVAIEIIFCASYSLMAISAKENELTAAFDYMALSMVGSFLLLLMAGAFYAFTGHLNMAAASEVLAEGGHSTEAYILGSLALLIFGLQAGIFPLYFWLPDSYPLLPSNLAALFGGVLTKVGFYILLRFFVTILPHDLQLLYDIALAFAILTMFLGVLGAVAKGSIKEILSYHITSQTGYMVMALSLFSPKAITGAIFFLLHNIVVKSSLYLLGGVASLFYRSDRLDAMGGAWQKIPIGGILFFIQAMSLAGIPPLSGFWGKYLIVFDALSEKYWLAATVAMMTSFFTFFSMIKIWSNGYMGQPPVANGDAICSEKGALILSTLPLIAATLFFSLFVEPSIAYIDGVSKQLFSQESYRESVINKGSKGAL